MPILRFSAGKCERAGGGLEQSGQDAQQGGFSAARRTQHTDEFARLDGERDRVKRVQTSVAVGESDAQIMDSQDGIESQIPLFAGLDMQELTIRNSYGRNSFVNAFDKSSGWVSKPISSKTVCIFSQAAGLDSPNRSAFHRSIEVASTCFCTAVSAWARVST